MADIQPDRSNLAETRNPLLRLESFHHLLALPGDTRELLRAVLVEIRSECHASAKRLWKQRKPAAACYWKVAAVYLGHISGKLRQGATSGAKIALPGLPASSMPVRRARSSGGLGGLHNPVVTLSGFQRLLQLPPSVKALLRDLLREIRAEALANADKSWNKHKAPMAYYWLIVAAYAGDLSRTLRDAKVPATAVVDFGGDLLALAA